MPAQNDATLQMINANNAGFGTMRFDPRADSGNYQDHLVMQGNQLPSVYYGLAGSDDTTRFRPLHRAGFLATTARTRVYFAVAGMINQITNPRTALSSSLQQVQGPVYKSKYYVFVRLGVNLVDFQASIAAMIANAQAITTDDLVDMNARSQATGPTGLYYVNAGALTGTFWARKHAGWESSFFPSNVNKRLRPLCLMDFRIQPNQVVTAQGTGAAYAASIALVPTARNQVHTGHTLITPGALANWYAAQNFASLGAPVPGATIWNKYDWLGQYQQNASFATNNYDITGPQIASGNEYYARDFFNLFPVTNPNANAGTAQSQSIVSMIDGFVNN
ncbi:Uncharacterised protein [Pannonibacter phragmitetus]|uniref:Uncharacterized protein n=1 Tax=Pannonibacter phragmitetus TaxID=121719 RepID=A0A378ZS71_9HYPH|nr:hypothetical protein [Pannonibacter phragmitetus]SUA99853.1 Uncharacterised protein [Pannonibacter phragmitetus]